MAVPVARPHVLCNFSSRRTSGGGGWAGGHSTASGNPEIIHPGGSANERG